MVCLAKRYLLMAFETHCGSLSRMTPIKSLLFSKILPHFSVLHEIKKKSFLHLPIPPPLVLITYISVHSILPLSPPILFVPTPVSTVSLCILLCTPPSTLLPCLLAFFCCPSNSGGFSPKYISPRLPRNLRPLRIPEIVGATWGDSLMV